MNLDGCYFGTTFPHLFLHMYGDQMPALPTEQYVPKIYGFKVRLISAVTHPAPSEPSVVLRAGCCLAHSFTRLSETMHTSRNSPPALAVQFHRILLPNALISRCACAEYGSVRPCEQIMRSHCSGCLRVLDRIYEGHRRQ